MLEEKVKYMSKLIARNLDPKWHLTKYDNRHILPRDEYLYRLVGRWEITDHIDTCSMTESLHEPDAIAESRIDPIATRLHLSKEFTRIDIDHTRLA
jgi:hypothetical protein